MTFLASRTLYSRLIASHLLVALVGIALISILASRFIFQAARDQVEQNYKSLLMAASDELEQPLFELTSGQGPIEAVRDIANRQFSRLPELSYTIFLPDGAPLLAETSTPPIMADPASDPEVWQALQSDLGEGRDVRPNLQGVETLYLAEKVSLGDQVYGVVRVEIPLETALGAARRSVNLLLLTNLFVALGVSLVGYLLARNLAKPIKNLTSVAESLSQGNLSSRVVTPANPQELNSLAEALNKMASRLEASMDELRDFVANASHELRTPLTSVKLRVEALRSGALEDPVVAERFLSEIESEVDRLSRMVNDLLDLSRIEAGLASKERSRLDLATIASEVCETFSARAERMGVIFSLDSEPHLLELVG
jgi:signal transduction histidine kinase